MCERWERVQEALEKNHTQTRVRSISRYPVRSYWLEWGEDSKARVVMLQHRCKPGGAYYRYRPWETFLSIRFAPNSDQTINGFVLGGGYRITKYFSVMIGYSVTPVDEPSLGFRVAAAQMVTANPTIAPYNRYNAADLLSNKPGAFDGFPLKVYDANGVTTQNLFPSSPTVKHYRSGIYFGVGIPLNLTALFKPSGK